MACPQRHIIIRNKPYFGRGGLFLIYCKYSEKDNNYNDNNRYVFHLQRPLSRARVAAYRSVVCLIYNVIFLFINKPTELDLSATPSFNTEAYLMRLNLPIMVSICFTVVCIIVLVAVFAKNLKGELKKAFHQ